MATTLFIPSEVEGSYLLGLPRPLALLDQLPKLACLAQLRVLRHRQFAAEKEIPKRVLVQNAMDGDALVSFLEIDPVIFRPIAIQLLSLALDYAKPLRIKVVQILGQNLELCQQFKLQPFR
jgi:hypothetical protein